MKKIYLTLTVVSAIGLLIFFGCSKENNQTLEKQKNVFQPTEKDLQIKAKILDFESKIDFARENPALKSGGDDLTVEETVWNIEALINYNYADASSSFDAFVNDSLSVSIGLVNGKVSIVTATALYDQIIDSLTAQYYQIQSQEKHLVITDISLKESDDETATFYVSSGFGKGSVSGCFSSFDQTIDYWKWGLGNIGFGGYCGGPNSGNNTDSDAAERIEDKINCRISLPVGHSYFVDISEVYISGINNEIVFEPNGVNITCECCDLTNPNDQTANDNMYDYYMFRSYSEYPNHHDCLIPNEMNFYLSGMETITYEIVYDCFPALLEDKIFVSTNIEGNYYIPPNSTTYFHHAWTNYGVSVGSGDPPPKEF